MEWVSNANRVTHENDGTIFTLKSSKVGVKIHKIHGCGNKFYLSCSDLAITQFGLNTEDFNIAVENAREIIKVRLKMLNEKFDTFLIDNSENKIVRY